MRQTDHRCWIILRHLLAGAAVLLTLCLAANASGPRYVSGPPYFTGPAGRPIGWAQSDLRYYTDPGDLSASVNHAAADQMVAAAAGVWNVPVANITLSQGGVLAEHVSGRNVYLASNGVGTNGLVFPDDVSTPHAASVPIAVIYDADGSVTDTLLGAGASLPSGCRQNAVTESVDGFDPAGYITHAILVINGRCTGPAPQQQLEMQYKLERVFGRVLGLAWSQVNDNVFTGTPQPTYAQALHWPILHPIDIVCGPYSYQCLPAPFQLRDDDLASLVLLYPVNGNAVPAGKQVSLASASGFLGQVTFPTGEGMAGVNVLVRRNVMGVDLAEPWFAASAVSGTLFRRADRSPFVPADTGPRGSQGTPGKDQQGLYQVAYVPLDSSAQSVDYRITTEAVNPLYRGSYALGPYADAAVAPSGSPVVAATQYYIGPGYSLWLDLPVADAAPTCGEGLDGTPAQPMALPAGGWWNGVLCGYGHASYTMLNVRAGRSFTIEVTAQDEHGTPTQSKAMPVLALADPADAAGALPGLGVSAAAFQGRATGTTVLTAQTPLQPAQTTQMRLGIADQRGDGRPDYFYAARVLYADTITPQSLPAAGASVKIAGFGFRPGNGVTVNGVSATVTALMSSEITVTLPSMQAAKALDGQPLDVVVFDPATGGSSTMFSAVTYTVAPLAPNLMLLVHAPQGPVDVGVASADSFTVRMVRSDGVTPVAGVSVSFSSASGNVLYSACGLAACTLVTDAQGLASTSIMPQVPGSLTLRADAGSLEQTATLRAQARAFSMGILQAPVGKLDVGVRASQPFVVRVYGADGQTGIPGRTIIFSVPTGQAKFDGCAASTCAFTADATGAAVAWATPLAAGPLVLRAADEGLSQSITLTAVAHTDTMQLVQSPAHTLYVGQNSGPFTIRLLRDDGTPDYFQPVVFSGSPGLHVGICGFNACTLNTDSGGEMSVALLASAPGTYTATATFGTLSQSVTVVVTEPQQTIRVLSAPAGDQPVGRPASVPFAAQVLEADGVTPVQNIFITLGGPNDAVRLDCGDGDCSIWVDGNGIASSWVTPIRPGPIVLSAVSLTLSATATFNAVGSSDTLWVLAAPPESVFTGDPQSFTIQVFGPDGVTPAANKSVQFSVTNGSFAFSCASSPCVVDTDSSGKASVVGTASAAGSVWLQAAEGGATANVHFTASVRPDQMQLVNGPLPNAFTHEPAGTFSVKVLLPDGITPASGRYVTFAVTNGQAQLSVCANSPCIVTTDASGLASTVVTPTSLGNLQLFASEGGASVTASIAVHERPDVLTLVSAPASPAYAGDRAAMPFAVRVLLPDGTTAVAGRSVTLSVTQGSGALTSCAGRSSCTLQSDPAGLISSTVTPLVAGTITLLATDGTVSQSATFLAVDKPDTMSLVSAPSGAQPVGVVTAAAFSVRLLQGDGVTPAAGKEVVFSSGNAASFSQCGAATCTVVTDAQGVAVSTLTPLAGGPVSLTATFATLSKTAVFQAFVRADVLTLRSAPSAPVAVGTTAPTLFSVQLFQGDGVTPDAGQSIQLSSAGGATFLACQASSCRLTTDASGVISTALIPLVEGTVGLQADWAGSGPAAGLSARQTASFQAFNRPRILQVVTAPADGSLVGDQAAGPFTVRLLSEDGVTPLPKQSVTVSVTNGLAQFTACAGASPCALQTDAQGIISTPVVPLSAGSITVTASQGAVSANATFRAAEKPDVLRLVSAPSGHVLVKAAASAAFKIAVVKADGTTPSPGVAITFASGGKASFDACGATTCRLFTSADGTISSGVTPLSSGTVTLTANAPSGNVSASFTAIDPPRLLRLLSAPADGSLAGDPAAIPFTVQVLEADGITPVANVNVTLTVTDELVRLAACSGSSVCTLTTDANGMVTTGVVPLAAGAIILQASYGSAVVIQSFVAVSKPDTMTLVSAPAGVVPVKVQASASFTVRVMQGDGVTPAVGKPVLFSSGMEVVFSACGGASCTVMTGADGTASTAVTPQAAGPVMISAAFGSLTVRATFSAAERPRVMRLVSAPADGALAGDAAQPDFAVQLLDADGVSPAAGANVTFSVTNGKAHFDVCGTQPSCSIPADASGMVRSAVTPLAAGPITLLATDGEAAQSATFNARPRPDTIQMLSAPSGTVAVGSQAADLLRVRVLEGDQVTPAAGRSVRFTADHSVVFGACGQASCALVTGTDGIASTSVTPLVAGTVGLVVTEGTLTASASFSAVLRAASMQVVTAPPDGGLQGNPASLPFTVRVLDGDGTTPAAGETVLFSVTNGAATLGACGAAQTCAMVTDAEGRAAMNVVPASVGLVTLHAVDGTLNASVSFMVEAKADVVRLVSAPGGNVLVGDDAALPMALQVMLGDGVTPAPGRSVVFSVTGGSASFDQCSGSSCTLVTDASGAAATPVRALAAGDVTLQAVVSGVTKSAGFHAITRVGQVTLGSAPAEGAFVGSVAPQAFAVHVVRGDGVSAAVGEKVTLSVTDGSALLNACGSSTCLLTVDSAGDAASTVTPLAPGAIALLASAGSSQVSVTFHAVLRPDQMSIVSHPSPTVYEGAVDTASLTIRMTLADGKTPVAGMPVVFALDPASRGKVTFEACGTVSCTLVTDAMGSAGSAVRGVLAGDVLLSVTPEAVSQAAPASVAMKVVANAFAVTAVEGPIFVAEGATVPVTLSVLATENNAPQAALEVVWTGSAGMMTPLVTLSRTDANGVTQVGYALGPLRAGQSADASACAWANVCAGFTATAIDSSRFALEFLSGNVQSVATQGAFVPVVARVTDGSGHPVAGAAVNVYEVVRGAAVPCPGRGRCPAAPVLDSRASALISGQDGTVSLLPLEGETGPAQLQMDFTAGTQGTLSTTLLRTE